MILLTSSFVYSDEALLDQPYSEADSGEEISPAPRQKPQGQNFFDKGKADQNFFGGKNMSSSSIFSAEPSASLQMNTVLVPNQENKQANEFDVSQKESNEAAQSPQENIVEQVTVNQQEEVVSPSSQENQDLNNIKSDDAEIQNVIEHSRKIRQAIFGEEAAKMLPKQVADKLKSSQPAKKTEEMRF